MQIKCDGTYRTVSVDGGVVTFTSRSGEESYYQELAQYYSQLPDGVYVGELLVKGETNRAVSNV